MVDQLNGVMVMATAGYAIPAMLDFRGDSTSNSTWLIDCCENALNRTVCNGTNGTVTSDCTQTTTASMTHNKPYDLWLTAIFAFLAAVTSITTTAGNIMVVLSFALEKAIRQQSNYLIASLAVTDILIGAFSMPLYTLYLLEDYWLLGQVVCDLWLSLDYTVCLVSQYTVFLITLDRFCSVKVPTKYRNWRTERKMKAMIAVTWVVPALIFFTSILGWQQFVGGEPIPKGQCYAQFHTNRVFSAILVISYFWVTLVVMIGLYAGIYKVALQLQTKSKVKRKRIDQTIKPSNGTVRHNGVKSQEKHSDDSYNESTPPASPSPLPASKRKRFSFGRSLFLASPAQTALQKAQQNKKTDDTDSSNCTESNHGDSANRVNKMCGDNSMCGDNRMRDDNDTQLDSLIWKPRNSLPNTCIHWDAFTDSSYTVLQANKDPNANVPNVDAKTTPTANTTSSEQSACKDSSSSPRRHEKPSILLQVTKALVQVSVVSQRRVQKSKSENRARKALRTITFILGAFVICWTPYHVIVLVEAKWPDTVNKTFYAFTYWLCYMNSPINPFCYAFANQQFKKAFLKILKGEYFQNWVRNRRR